MKLSEIDLNYINHRMDTYDIKYQEIYDEIKDHIISAIETARADGDQRNIVYVFDDLMEAHFPGYWAFQKISKQYEKAYRAKIRKTLWANMKDYLNWQTIPLIALSVIIGFYLPHDKRVSLVFVVLLIVTSIVPYFYVLQKSQVIRPNEGKKSMVKNHVVTRAFLLLALINVILNLIGMIGRDYHISYLNPRYFHPVVYVLLLSFFIIYGLCSMRLCRQEIKITDSTGS